MRTWCTCVWCAPAHCCTGRKTNVLVCCCVVSVVFWDDHVNTCSPTATSYAQPRSFCKLKPSIAPADAKSPAHQIHLPLPERIVGVLEAPSPLLVLRRSAQRLESSYGPRLLLSRTELHMFRRKRGTTKARSESATATGNECRGRRRQASYDSSHKN